MIYLNIMDFGCMGDGIRLDSPAIQQAIDKCYKNGGGVVEIPTGKFLIGTIELKENVFLQLALGAVLLASGNLADYRKAYAQNQSLVVGLSDSPFNLDQYLIYAKNCKNIGIIGHGIIQAGGSSFFNREHLRPCAKMKDGFKEYSLGEWRPGSTVCFLDCEEVKVQNITILDNPMFALALMHCKEVLLQGIKVKTDTCIVNGDGIHLKSSTDVIITDCMIDAEDDAICFYTDNWEFVNQRPANNDCVRVTVSNCICSSACSGIRFGYMGDGRIANILLNNIIIKKAKTALDFICNGGQSSFDSTEHSFQGSVIENIKINNLIAEDSYEGLRMNLHNSARGDAVIRNISFVNCSLNARHGHFICGSKHRKIENITFTNCDLKVSGDIIGMVELATDPLPIFSGDAASPFGLIVRHAGGVIFSASNISQAMWQTSLLSVDCDIDMCGSKD